VVNDPKKPVGFVSLTSIKRGPPDPHAALAELRQIYFKTTKRTIDHDFDHAIDLLKSLPTEDAREKAVVYMEGIAQMRKEWGAGNAEKTEKRRKASHGGTEKQRRTEHKKK
jgi:hypothetical protein